MRQTPKEKSQTVHQQYLDILLASIKEAKETILPQCLETRIKTNMNNHLEAVFAVFKEKYIENKETQEPFVRLVDSHFEIIKSQDWSGFDLDIVNLFQLAIVDICKKYHVNARLSEAQLDQPKIAHVEEKIKSNSIMNLEKLHSLPLHEIFEEDDKYFARVAPYSIFVKLFNTEEEDLVYKAYYQKTVTESTTADAEQTIKERRLTSFEINEFELYIKEFQTFRCYLLVILNEIHPLIPALAAIIMKYISYNISFKEIANIEIKMSFEGVPGFSGEEKHRYFSHSGWVNKQPGNELFDQMRMDKIYMKNDFLYCSWGGIVYRWRKRDLEKDIYEIYLNQKKPVIRQYQGKDPTTKQGIKIDEGILAMLTFFNDKIKADPKSGQVFQEKQQLGKERVGACYEKIPQASTLTII